MHKISISPHEFDLCKMHARKACIGGKSQFRKEDRFDTLYMDNLIGQLGNCTLSKWLTGRIDAWMQTRYVANQNPYKGDGGSDLLGSNIDVKTSLMRKEQDPWRYNLVVAPKELHQQDWIYILGLVPKFEADGIAKEVWLVGWATGEEVASRGKRDGGKFKDFYVVKSRDLHRLPPFTWSTDDYEGSVGEEEEGLEDC